jgi:hypothetical protein
MMERLREKGYENLDNQERFQLAIAFMARGDDEEVEHLKETFPRERYKGIDAELVEKFDDAERFALQVSWNLLRTQSVLDHLDTLTEVETTTKEIEYPDGETVEFEAPNTLMAMIEQRENELYRSGIREGIEAAGGDLDDESIEDPQDVTDYMAPSCTLENVVNHLKRVAAARCVESFEAFKEICKERFSVDLDTLIQTVDPSPVHVVDKCWRIIEEADAPDDLQLEVDDGVSADHIREQMQR